MPTKKSSSTLAKSKKSTTTAKKEKAVKVETVSIKLHIPGSLPETVKVATSLSKLIEDRGLGNYDVTVNGSKVASDYTLVKNDIVRIGFPSKSAN